MMTMAGRSRGTFVMSSRTASYALLMVVTVGAGVAVMRWVEPISPAAGCWLAYGADSGNTKYSAFSKTGDRFEYP
jgi:hypothetical protein